MRCAAANDPDATHMPDIQTDHCAVVDAASAIPPTGLGEREPLIEGPESSGFTFLHANVQGFASKSAEIAHLIERCNFPDVVGFTESFLEDGKSASLHGYSSVARLDRRTGEKQGGILLFAKSGFENSIVHVGDSDVHERSDTKLVFSQEPRYSKDGTFKGEFEDLTLR